MNWLQIIFSSLSLVLVIAVAVKVYLRNRIVLVKKGKRLNGKVAVVTGANCGIGFETAKFLAKRGAKVILACRNVAAGEKAADDIKDASSSANVEVRELDLGSMESVRRFCQEIVKTESRLDILVNNAGTSLLNKVITADGLETHMAVNHFGPFLLTNILLDLMKRTPKSRIVNVASITHSWTNVLDLENLNSEKIWEPSKIYAKTKLCNVLFSNELHRRLKKAGISDISVNSLHPGAVKTQLFRDAKTVLFYNILIKLGEIFFKSPWEGAQTSIHLATSDEVEGISGKYWDNCQIKEQSRLAGDSKLANDLWDISAKMVKLKDNENHV